MKIRALIGVWLVALMGLAMCGASLPDIGLSSNRGKMAVGLKTSLANGGGGAAGWDTVTVIFSPGARVDSTATTGKWLFPIPTAYTGADTVKNPRQNHRIWRLNDKILGRGDYPGGGSWRADNADTARVLRLGTGKAVPTFAWSNIKQADTNGYYPAQYVYNHMERRQIISGVGYMRQKITAVGDSSIIPMFYLPFEDHIPANSTIVNATVSYCSPNATYQGVGDTIISVLMTNANDDEWYKTKGGTGLTNSPNYARASWLRQTDDNGDAWDGDENNAWSPGLTARGYYWSMGNTSDWSGSIMAATSYYYAEQAIPVDITDCVQAAVSGETNNGIMHIQKSTSTNNRDNTLYGWDTYSSAAKHEPYVAVKYITKRYQKPFGSADWAMVFQTDDLKAIANKAYADTLQARGGKFTMFGFKQYLASPGIGTVGVNDQTRALSLAELFDLYSRGNEYGSHSKFHSPAKGYHNRIVAGGGIASAAYDSMVVDYSPNWMYVVADSARALGIIDEDMRSSSRYAKSFGAPVSVLEAYAQRVLVDHGYKAWRTLSTFSSFDREKYYTTAGTGLLASADSAMTNGTYQAGRRVRSIREQYPWEWTLRIVGPPDSTSASLTHLPKVTHNIRRLIEQRRGNDTRVVHFFIHDLKSGGSGQYAGEGMNADELGRIAYVTNLLGGRWMTVSELGNWYEASSTFIDHPFNASRPDTFQMFATDRVWAKPNGIDNRWIPSVRTPRAVANSFDSTAPPAPASALAYGQNRSVVLTWAPSATAEAVSYRIYRFFDNAADTVMVGTSNTPFYQDLTAVNGSPHNYYVTAVDAAGNESAPTASFATTPGTIRTLDRPAYWAFWYQDPADDVELAQADVEKLAEFDMIVGSPHSLEGPEVGEVGFDGLLGRIRAINPDAIYLTYYTAFCVYDYWADSPPLSVHKRVWDYMMSLPDSSGFALDETGARVRGDDYPGQMYNNVMIPSLADTIAKILVETYQNSGTDGEWAGFFLDDSDTSLSEWMCNGNDCGDLIDFDQDGTTFSEGVNGDPEEKAAFKEWHLRLVRGIRREFAERGMQNRLITANTTWGRKADPSPKDDQYMGLLDGMLNEAWNLYWPGPTVPTDTAKWDLALDWGYQLTHAQTAPPLVMWNARADSSAQYMNEVLAYANGGLVNANLANDWSSDSSAPVMGRRKAALTGGALATAFYDTVAGNATADTLRVVSGDLVARMVMSRNAGDLSNQYAVWPYLITDNTKSPDDVGYYLSRSAFWPLPEDEGPPVIAQSQILTGDRMLTLAIGVGLDGQPPGDFSHFSIAREYKIGATAYYDTFTVDPDTLVMVNGTTNSWWWYDTGLTNGRQYKYKVFLVDMLGNIGDPAPQVTQTPGDIAPPAVPADLVASGGDGFVDLDWPGVSAADLVGYQISRATDDGGAPGSFAVTDTVTISAHQDSTAISGNIYHYYVKSLDDDDNISAESDTAFGGWIGSPPATYLAPQLVRVVPNYTATATAVLVYPPQDVTGLTGYTVYRGPWNGVAATDTTDCIKRISINATPDSYNAHTFIDNTANTTPDSAFQYTAVALYSGNRSKKYSPPAGAFTDGGFAATTPTLAAFGNGTNILLAVGTVSGADSTRVYRGTSAVAQTSLASINAANNPYTDTTAAANTDYWYKVRQYDVQTAAWSNYSTVSGPVRWTSVPSGTPSISGVNEGVDNTVQHGEAVVIAGSNFGVNDVAADFSDGFESGAFQSPWNLSDGGYSQGFSTVVAAGANARHGASSYVLKTSFPSTSGNAHQCIYRDPFTTLYAQYWVKLDNNFDFGGPGSSNNYGPTELANVKFFRLWPYGSSQEDFVTAFHKYLTTHGAVVEVENTDPYPHSWYAWGGFANPGEFTKNVWHLFQFEYRSSSGLGVADGVFKWTVDGDVKFSRSDIVTMKNTNTPKDEVWLGFGDTTSGWNYDGANDVYFDDIYITPTFARVELGTSTSNPSNPTYAQCDHREIQAPTDWTSTSVSITANTGSFADGNVYLFVIDEDGTASPGQLVTIDNP